MKHKWYLDEYGEADVWRLEEGYHNGPECMRCGGIFCENCAYDLWDQECPVKWDQGELF